MKAVLILAVLGFCIPMGLMTGLAMWFQGRALRRMAETSFNDVMRRAIDQQPPEFKP